MKFTEEELSILERALGDHITAVKRKGSTNPYILRDLESAENMRDRISRIFDPPDEGYCGHDSDRERFCSD